MKKLTIAFITLVLLCLTALAMGKLSILQNKNQDDQEFAKQDFIRIHIRASSDSPFDQAAKLRVRDNVTAFLSQKLKHASSKEQALETINEHVQALTDICNLTLSQCGADYKAQISLSRETFPQRTYGGKVFPEGVYDSLVIKLDQGTGKNWWCVAYPPLCFICGTENPEAPDEIRYDSLLLQWINGLLNK